MYNIYSWTVNVAGFPFPVDSVTNPINYQHCDATSVEILESERFPFAKDIDYDYDFDCSCYAMHHSDGDNFSSLLPRHFLCCL